MIISNITSSVPQETASLRRTQDRHDTAVDTCRQAVASGHWPLFRYNPALAAAGQNPLQFDSPEPTLTFSEYALKQNRYRMLQKADPETSAELMKEGNRVTASRFDLYRKLAEIQTGFSSGE